MTTSIQVPADRAETDWIGLWYKIARDDRGVNDLFTLTKANLVTGSVVRRLHISHEFRDGIGALTEILRGEGFKIPEVPHGREHKVPNFWGRLKILRRFFQISQPRKVVWSGLGDSSKKQNLEEIAWSAFNQRDTRLLELFAKERKVSLNSVLLATFNNVLAPRLVKEPQPLMWLFPVNLRGAVKRRQEVSNHSSATGVEFFAGIAYTDAHARIKEQLKNRIYWGTWWMLHIGKFIGYQGMRWLSARRAQNNTWMGTFSSLGVWPPQGSVTASSANNPQEVWFPSPPGTVNFPVSIATITWNGQLVLSLKIHPSVCAEFAMVKDLLTETRRQLLALIPIREVPLTPPEPIGSAEL